MSEEGVAQDIALAQDICKQLRQGNREAIHVFYERYQSQFKAFAQKRLYYQESWEDVLSDFWLSLLDGKIICKYKGTDGASLSTYLTKILYRRIINENRRFLKEQTRRGARPAPEADALSREYHHSHSDPPFQGTQGSSGNLDLSDEEQGGGGEAEERVGESDAPSRRGPQGPAAKESHVIDMFEGLLQARRVRLVHEALLQLEQLNPDDALLVRFRMEGYSYQEILALPPWVGCTDDALRQRWSRAMKEFKVILQRIMERDGLRLKDLLKD